MSSSVFKMDGKLCDMYGIRMDKIYSADSKNYAVIAKSGHCGRGYYMPVIFYQYCKDAQTAIELIKANPRIQRHQKDVILGVFELSKMERIFLGAINENDRYLTDNIDESTEEIRERRIAYPEREEYDPRAKRRRKYNEKAIRTADEYSDEWPVSKYFAPRQVGDKLLYPTKVNKDELLANLFTQSCIKYGIKGGNVAFLTYYWQMYGDDNPLGVTYYKGHMFYRNKFGNYEGMPISEVLMQKMQESGAFDVQENVEEQQEIIEPKTTKKSVLDRFNRRLQKTAEIQSEKQRGEE